MILDLSILPKRHPDRVAAAKRIRAIRFEDHWQKNWRRIRAASVWTKRFAVACMQSGELFDCPAKAARRFRTHPNSIRRCAESGINLHGKMAQFIWLNGVRWYEKNVWNSTGSVGCVENGQTILELQRSIAGYRAWRSLSGHFMVGAVRRRCTGLAFCVDEYCQAEAGGGITGKKKRGGMKIEIGRTIPDGKPVRLDLAKLVDSRLLITVSSGGGKSWALRLLAELASPTVQTVILDPEGEFASLREKFDFLLVAKGGEIQPEVRAAGLLARKLAEIQVSAVIDLFDLHFEQRREFVRQFLESLVNMPRTLWHSMIVILDEAHKFCPEGKDTESSNAVIDLMSQGRKRGLCGILATQRLSKLNKDAAAEANNNLIGRTPLGNDQKRAADILGLEKSDWHRLRDLPDGGWFGFGPAFSDQKGVVDFVTADVQTTHPKAGQRHKLTPPKASEAVKQIAAQLADLPQQAEAEIKSMDDARRRIKELEREARQRPVVEKPVETVKRVEIPVLREREAKRLEKFVEGAKSLAEKLDGVAKVLCNGKVEWAARAGAIEVGLKAARREGEKQPAVIADKPKPFMWSRDVLNKPRAMVPAVERQPKQITDDDSGESKVLTGGPRKALTALLQFPEGLYRDQIGAIIGYKASSRNVFLRQIVADGFAEVNEDKFVATEKGRQALPRIEMLPTGVALQEYWLERLPEGPSSLLKILIDAYPEAMDRDSVGESIGYKRSSRNVFIRDLITRKLVEKVGKGGAVRASANLFDVMEAR